MAIRDEIKKEYNPYGGIINYSGRIKSNIKSDIPPEAEVKVEDEIEPEPETKPKQKRGKINEQ